MKDIDVIYKILHILHSNMDNPNNYDSLLTAEALGLSVPKWCHIMVMLAKEGYISGVERIETFDTIGNGYPNIKLERPGIGLKGLEYLAENPLMVKAAKSEGKRIQSLFFDAKTGHLEINGKKYEKAVIVRWPETLDNDAWQSGLLINESKEDGLKRFERRENLPVLEIVFKDGTGSYSINNKN